MPPARTGVLSFGIVAIPVRVHPAIKDQHVAFRAWPLSEGHGFSRSATANHECELLYSNDTLGFPLSIHCFANVTPACSASCSVAKPRFMSISREPAVQLITM